jgi:hypothetical protein
MVPARHCFALMRQELAQRDGVNDQCEAWRLVRGLDVSDYGLAALGHMNMFDANKLGPAISQPS